MAEDEKSQKEKELDEAADKFSRTLGSPRPPQR